MGACCSSANHIDNLPKKSKQAATKNAANADKDSSKTTQATTETLDKLLEVVDPTKTPISGKSGATGKESGKDKKRRVDNKDKSGAGDDANKAEEENDDSKQSSASANSESNTSDPSAPNQSLSPSGAKRDGATAGSANEPNDISAEEDGSKGKVGSKSGRGEQDSNAASSPQNTKASVLRGESAESDAGETSALRRSSVRSTRSRAEYSTPSSSNAQDSANNRRSPIPSLNSNSNYPKAVETLNRVMEHAQEGYDEAGNQAHPHEEGDENIDEEEVIVSGTLHYIHTSDISQGWCPRYVVIHCEEKNFSFFMDEEAFNNNQPPLEPNLSHLEIPPEYYAPPAYTLTNTLVSTGKRAAKRALEVLGCRLSALGSRDDVPCYIWLEGQANAERSLCMKEGRIQPLMLPSFSPSSTFHTLCQTPIPPAGILLRALTPTDAKEWKLFFMESGAINRTTWDAERDRLAKLRPVPEAPLAPAADHAPHGQHGQHGQENRRQHRHGEGHAKDGARDSRDSRDARENRHGRHGTSTRSRN